MPTLSASFFTVERRILAPEKYLFTVCGSTLASMAQSKSDHPFFSSEIAR
jgi:hypothetical protein